VVEMEIQRKVIEYRIVGGTGACGRAQRNTFPARIEAPVQYGPGVSAFAVYMTQYQLLPYQRTAEVFNELAGLGTSPGTLQRTVRMAATRPEVPVTAIRRALVAAPVAHADETGRHVNGNLYRLHVLSTDRFTACFPHPKRGAEAPDAFGLLAPFAGVLVHDHGAACQCYSCWQAFCNIRRLREHRNEVLRSLAFLCSSYVERGLEEFRGSPPAIGYCAPSRVRPSISALQSVRTLDAGE